MYKTIEKLRPYFFSLREIKGKKDKQVSLDIKFPVKWKYDYDHSELIVMVQEQNEKFNLISFVMPATEVGYETVNSVALSIIKFNIELEEKEQLFQDKVTELKDLFAKESLDKLKEINFTKNDGEEKLSIEPSSGVVE